MGFSSLICQVVGVFSAWLVYTAFSSTCVSAYEVCVISVLIYVGFCYTLISESAGCLVVLSVVFGGGVFTLLVFLSGVNYGVGRVWGRFNIVLGVLLVLCVVTTSSGLGEGSGDVFMVFSGVVIAVAVSLGLSVLLPLCGWVLSVGSGTLRGYLKSKACLACSVLSVMILLGFSVILACSTSACVVEPNYEGCSLLSCVYTVNGW